jgi:hypothetical protein
MKRARMVRLAPLAGRGQAGQAGQAAGTGLHAHLAVPSSIPKFGIAKLIGLLGVGLLDRLNQIETALDFSEHTREVLLLPPGKAGHDVPLLA